MTAKVIKREHKQYVDAKDFYIKRGYYCGSCKKLIVIDRHNLYHFIEKDNYCKHCGKELEWL